MLLSPVSLHINIQNGKALSQFHEDVSSEAFQTEKSAERRYERKSLRKNMYGLPLDNRERCEIMRNLKMCSNIWHYLCRNCNCNTTGIKRQYLLNYKKVGAGFNPTDETNPTARVKKGPVMVTNLDSYTYHLEFPSMVMDGLVLGMTQYTSRYSYSLRQNF